MRRPALIALSTVSFAALALGTTPAVAQTPDPVKPTGDPCQAPSDQVDKSKCPDVPPGETSPTDAPAGTSTAGTTDADAPAVGGDEILVVGSRIRRDEFNTADSVQVLTRKESTQAGFVSTAEILQSTAVTGGTSQINDQWGGFVINGGPGVNTISLRGLGTTRTLVLMNGRRVTPAGSRGAVGSADLNVLPNAMIDRIEILNTGASSIYGSDAVAGVVNIVTRTNVRGLSFEAQNNVPIVGTGRAGRYSVVGGWGTDRLSLSGSVEYFKRNTMTIGDVDWARCPTTRYGTNGSDFGAADIRDPVTGEVRCFPFEQGGTSVNVIGTRNINVLTNTTSVRFAPGVLELAPAGTGIVQCNRFQPNAGVTTGTVPGYECVGGSYFTSAGAFLGGIPTSIRDTTSNDRFKQDMISPAKIWTAYAQANYELEALGNADVYLNFLGTRRKSEQNDTRQFLIDYLPNSPLIPASLRPASGLNAAVGIRAFSDYGLYNNRQTVDYYRVNAGITGELPFRWRYDLFAGRSKSKAKYTTDLILTDRLNNTLNVVASGSGFVCSNATARAEGCVSAPPVTPSVLDGQYPEDWFDYIVEPVTGRTTYWENTANLTVDGPIFALPGGNLAAALGVEYRKAKIDDTPSEHSQNNNLYGFTSSSPTRGSDSVWEGFGEVEAPLLRNQVVHSLTLNGSARYTHYKSYGGDWTYKVGGLFAPIQPVTFRGSYGTSYRAPALFEQFLGATSGFLPSTTDPCNDLASQTNPLVKERCLSEGLPPDFRQNSGVVVIGLGGAEAGLAAETSKALTYGLVLQPPLGDFGTLSLSADYFNIKIDNGVSRLSAGQVLSQCYNNPERTLCDTDFITRTPYTGSGTGVLTVIQSYVNISTAKVKGMDFNARLAKDVGPGRLTLGAALTRFKQRYSRTLATDEIVNLIGLIANPRWTGTFDANYEVNNFTFHWGTEWVGKTNANDYAEPFGFSPDRYDFRTPNYYMHNASIRYDTRDFGLLVGVRNIFDRDPPMISADWTNAMVGNSPIYSGYDNRGRMVFINARVGFGLGRQSPRR